MSAAPKKLLAMIEFIGHAKLPKLAQGVGYEIHSEWQVRKAISLLRKIKPDVIIADFYHQSDFRDRLSNLESLLAAAQTLQGTKILVFFDPSSQPALDKVRARLRIDVAMSTPVNEEELRGTLQGWL